MTPDPAGAVEEAAAAAVVLKATGGDDTWRFSIGAAATAAAKART